MEITKHRPKHIDQTQNPYFVTGRTYFGLPYFDTDETKEAALLSAVNLACKNYHLILDGWTILDNHYHLLFRPPGCMWEVGIAPLSGASSEEEGIAPLGAIKNFRIGKVVGTIHGKSSSLLKEIADKSAISLEERNGFERNEDRSSERNSAFTRDSSPHAAWWSAKYWEEIKRRNITLYGKRSQLAEEKRAKEFQRLLKEGTPEELANFTRKIDKVWYQYTDHVIRDKRDYYMHLNYTHQNCVKHGYTKNIWSYRFSSIHEYDRDWIKDCFRQYPIKDFEPEMEDKVE